MDRIVKEAAGVVDVSSESEDDSLVLGGVVRRDSSSSGDSDEDEADSKQPARLNGVSKNFAGGATATDKSNGLSKKRPNTNGKTAAIKTKKARKKQSEHQPKTEVVQVDFTFHDMEEKFYHGLKALLHESSTVYQAHSSTLADLLIENVSVGTVVSTEDDPDANVFGFASVLNVATYQESPAMQYLKEFCLTACPAERKDELTVVLSGQTKRPAGFLLHGRMINTPLEIVLTLHQQLVLDLDWAVENAEGGVEERKSLDFGALVRIAPCTRDGGAVVYRYFDDEVLAGRAELVVTADAPKSFSKEEPQICNVIVMTKTGHREAMNDLSKLVGG